MSTRQDIAQLVQVLSTGMADPAMCDSFYDEVLQLLAFTTEHSVASQLIPVSARVGTFFLPADAITLLAVAFGGRQLSPATERDLEALTPLWRDMIGSPSSYIEETEADRVFRLYPKPSNRSGDFDFSEHGTPLGEDYPTDAVHILYTQRTDDLPEEVVLPVTLLVLEREFSRVSNHSNIELGKAYGDLGRLLLSLLDAA